MSIRQQLVWRFEGAFYRLLGLANRVPIGMRRVEIDGATLHVDTIDRWLAAQSWRRGWLEADERALIRARVRPGMTVLDIGANVGVHTCGLAAAVGPQGRVVAVEPEPRNAALLRQTIAANGWGDRVRLIAGAASDVAGSLTLHVSAANRGDHRVTPGDDPRTAVTVPAVVLDDALSDLPPVDFIKMDVQGAEVAVLRGLRRTFARSPQVGVLCELSPALLRAAGASTAAFLAEFEAAGLTPHQLGANGALLPADLAVAERDAEREGYINLFYQRAAA